MITEVDSLHFFEGLQVSMSTMSYDEEIMGLTLLRVSGRMNMTHKAPRARVAMKMI